MRGKLLAARPAPGAAWAPAGAPLQAAHWPMPRASPVHVTTRQRSAVIMVAHRSTTMARPPVAPRARGSATAPMAGLIQEVAPKPTWDVLSTAPAEAARTHAIREVQAAIAPDHVEAARLGLVMAGMAARTRLAPSQTQPAQSTVAVTTAWHGHAIRGHQPTA